MEFLPRMERVNLLVDLGNSRLKWAQQETGLWHVESVALSIGGDMNKLLDVVWKDMPAPVNIFLCSVTAPATTRALEQWAQQHWSVLVNTVKTPSQQLGVVNRYRDPTQLGTDRWAALIGVRGLTTGAACVVDCGTAVTVDVLSAHGEYLGGAIFPGLRLLRDSLSRATEGIKTSASEFKDILALSTAEGVAAGTLYGLAGAVERLVDEYREKLGGNMRVFLTGGDAAQLATLLRVNTTEVPDLVLKGLARIAEAS